MFPLCRQKEQNTSVCLVLQADILHFQISKTATVNVVGINDKTFMSSFGNNGLRQNKEDRRSVGDERKETLNVCTLCMNAGGCPD